VNGSDGSNRPTFDALYMDLARGLAKRSTCRRLAVGCAIVSADYRYVYGVGYNGNASGLPNDCDSDTPGQCGCFIGSTKVVASDVSAAMRRRYEGEIVVVRTGEAEFSVTPNHPILVEGKGWVAAGQITRGDRLLKTTSSHGIRGREANHDDTETSIEEVFDSLLQTGLLVRRQGVAHDFHGDGSSHHDVDVVLANGFLRTDLETGESQRLGDTRFFLTDSAASSGARLCALHETKRATYVRAAFFGSHAVVHGLQSVAAPARKYSSLGESEMDHVDGNAGARSERFGGHSSDILANDLIDGEIDHCGALVHADVLGHFAQYTTRAKSFLNCGVAHLERVGNLQNLFSREVSADEVIDVKRHWWSGHVFNLETRSNWYSVVGGYIAHNCIHSEANAIINCRAPRSEAKVVIVTHQPCKACAKMLINLGGVERVLYAEPYRLREGLEALETAGIAVTALIG
jgi:deoxycytidylate deaminase